MDVTLIIPISMVFVCANLMSEMLLSKIAFSKILTDLTMIRLKGQILAAHFLEISTKKWF
jgi:hypothetical protein